MIEICLSTLFDKVSVFLSRYWLIKTCVCCVVLSLLLSTPGCTKLNQFIKTNPVYPFLSEQIENPLTPQQLKPISHESKRTFRLSMPLLSKLTGLSFPGLIAVQALLGLLFFVFTAKFTYNYSQDKVLSFFFTLGFTGIYIGKSFLLDYWSFFDGTAILFLLLSVCFKNPFIIFTTLSLAFWTDERAIIASYNILVFNIIAHLYNPDKSEFNWKPVIALAMALLVYGSIRFYLANNFALKTGNLGIGVLWMIWHDVKYVPISIFMFLESYWVYLIIASTMMIAAKQLWIYAFLFISGIFLQSFVALSVGDMVRSGAYLLVPCLTSFLILSVFERNVLLKRSIAFCLCISAFFIPTYSIFDSRVIWMKPDWLFDLHN